MKTLMGSVLLEVEGTGVGCEWERQAQASVGSTYMSCCEGLPAVKTVSFVLCFY